MPLAYALVGMVGLILALTWGALQVQVALAGFLNGESVWSKAQKQSVIALESYAVRGDPADLASYKLNYGVLMADHWARDQIASGHFDYDAVADAQRHGGDSHSRRDLHPAAFSERAVHARCAAGVALHRLIHRRTEHDCRLPGSQLCRGRDNRY